MFFLNSKEEIIYAIFKNILSRKIIIQTKRFEKKFREKRRIWRFSLLQFWRRLMALFPPVYSIQDGVTSILVLDLSIRRQIFLLLLRCKSGLLSCRLQNSSYPDGERRLHRSKERWKMTGQRPHPRFVIPPRKKSLENKCFIRNPFFSNFSSLD